MDLHETVVDELRKKDWKELAAELIYMLDQINISLIRIDDNLDILATEKRKEMLKR